MRDDVRDSTAVADDRRNDGVANAETLARLEVCGIQILRAMRKEVKP